MYHSLRIFFCFCYINNFSGKKNELDRNIGEAKPSSSDHMVDIFALEYFPDGYHATKFKLTQTSLKSAMSGISIESFNLLKSSLSSRIFLVKCVVY